MSAKKIFIIVHIVIISFFGTFIYFKFLHNAKELAPQAVSIAEVTAVTQENAETTGKPPSSLNLDVPFYTQAPFSNWDNPWQEACEEASVLLIANAYYDHNWTREQFNDQILKLVEWEKKRFGDYKHTSVEQTAEILADYLGLKTVIVENPSYEDIMKTLNKGHLILMTFAGKKIGNPNYKNGGPVYHAMVVKGYKEEKKVITHDVGTRKGEDYVYRWSVLQNALHDWAEPIESGEKRMIEVLPPSL